MHINLSSFFRQVKFIFSTLIIILFISCSSLKPSFKEEPSFKEKPLPSTKIGANANEVKLGNYNYYLIVPDDFIVVEGNGLEGQQGFTITSKDTSLPMYGYIETAHGEPVNDSGYNCKVEKVYKKSTLLNQEVNWLRCYDEDKFINLRTQVDNKFSIYAFCGKKEDVDYFISIISTLSEK